MNLGNFNKKGKIMTKIMLSLLLLAVCFVESFSADLLFDHSKGVSMWKKVSSEAKLEVITASNGEKMMHYRVPKFNGKNAAWPSFEAKFPIADWSGYELLTLEVINDSPSPVSLRYYIGDSKQPVRQGRLRVTVIQPYSCEKVIISLETLKQKSNISQMGNIHFFFNHPGADVNLMIGKIELVKLNEEVAPMDPVLQNEMVKKSEGIINNLEAKTLESFKKIGMKNAQNPQDLELLKSVGLRFVEAVKKDRTLVAQTDLSPVEKQYAMYKLSSMGEWLNRLNSLLAWRKTQNNDNEVLFASFPATARLFPQLGKLPVGDTTKLEMKLAGRERESRQIGLTPMTKDLEGVHLEWDIPVNKDGKKFPGVLASNPVGYVEVKTASPIGTNFFGWYPDIILTDRTATDVAKIDTQSFWVTAVAEVDATPGMYNGTVRALDANGNKLGEFPFNIEIYDFNVPAHSPLPLMMSSPLKGQSHEYATDFLAQYYIDLDHIYHGGNFPNFDLLERQRDRGQLSAFCLAYVTGPTAKETVDAAIERNKRRIRKGYDEAKRRGLLDYAYVYGFDENHTSLFKQNNTIVQALMAEFPDVTIYTTAVDVNLGESAFKDVQGWIPLTFNYDEKKVKVTRSKGKKVGWYICLTPGPPYANMMLENDPGEIRSLMGWQTAKYRPETFLYYQTILWTGKRISREPVKTIKGAYSDWNPLAFTVYHQDGMMIYRGENNTFIPSIRLELFRDGLEDYAYIRIAEAVGGEAKELTEVPKYLVKDLKNFSVDPAATEKYRDNLARAIENSGKGRTVNPWPKGSGINAK